MHSNNMRAARWFTIATTLVLAIMVASASAGRHSRKIISYDTPEEIEVPVGSKLHLAFEAVGLQNYIYNGTSWALQNATANLYVIGNGKLVGKHFFLPKPDAGGGQPSWETFYPQSLVTAKVLREITVDPNSITWALFQATSESGSKAALGAVTYLQRIQSKGGLPPPTSRKANMGDSHSTPYSIVYAYYVKEN